MATRNEKDTRYIALATRKKKDTRYMAFMQDVAAAMHKHGVSNMVCISSFDDKIRNTYLPMGNGEDPLYCHISDAMNAWLKQAQVRGMNIS